MSILLLQTAYNLIQREVVSAILPVIITSPQDSGFIHNLWHQNAELVLWGIIDAQHLKADSMLRIIEICHELKVNRKMRGSGSNYLIILFFSFLQQPLCVYVLIMAYLFQILSVVLESVPVSSSIRLAVLASLRGLLDIENWLPNCLYMYKDLFAEVTYRFTIIVLFLIF